MLVDDVEDEVGGVMVLLLLMIRVLLLPSLHVYLPSNSRSVPATNIDLRLDFGGQWVGGVLMLQAPSRRKETLLQPPPKPTE